YEFVRSRRVQQIAAAECGAMRCAAIAQLDIGAHRYQQVALGLDIPHVRNVLQNHGFFGQNSRGHRREGRVFGAAYADGPDQRVSAANYELIHKALQAARKNGGRPDIRTSYRPDAISNSFQLACTSHENSYGRTAGRPACVRLAYSRLRAFHSFSDVSLNRFQFLLSL